ncbi:MAG: hypothetical protein LBP22_12495 [Deltaproteobacteria bacterium]|jgi:hypothetical protein|nr:hypothetical protein [Deltaproteobacteria bacterium]
MYETYHPSGQYNPVSTLLVIVFGAVVSLITAIPYSYLTWYLPWAILLIIAPVGWGYLYGKMVGIFIKSRHIRNPKIAGLSGMLGMLPGYLLTFLCLVSLFINFEGETYSLGSGRKATTIAKSTISLEHMKEMLADPAATLEYVKAIAQQEFRTFFGKPLMGILLYIVWLAEFLILMFYSFISCQEAAAEPYAEDIQKFLKAHKLKKIPALPADEAESVKLIENIDVNYLISAPECPDPKKTDYFSLVVYYDPEAHLDAYLDVTVMVYGSSKKKSKHEASTIAKYMKIQPTDAAKLIARFQ